LKLAEMLTDEYVLAGDGSRDITGITHDSRAVKDGYLFVAVKGEKTDGHAFIGDAIAKGAAAVICEKGYPALKELAGKYPAVSWVEAADCREALAAFSDSLYGRPSEKTGVIGITGTNGKTTASYLIKAVLERDGKGVGLIGTIRYMIKDECFEAPHTTPEASDFQELLSRMAAGECDYVVTEVSSHALAQKRVDHTRFRVAIFTNLTGDHLDYHCTMENYYESKTRLFTGLLVDGGTAVINVDDHYGKNLSGMLAAHRPSVKQITFSLQDRDADVSVEDIKMTFRGTAFRLRMKSGSQGLDISTPLVGQTAVYNVLSAACAGIALDLPGQVIREGIEGVGLIKGRFERVDCGQPFLAVVDYAHTHDALERLIETARKLMEASAVNSKKGSACGKIITVFGCGGNRDRGKRPKMGRIASDLSDFVIVTSDNPRREDPSSIIRDIESGIEKDNYVIIQDRRIAIRMAIMLASPGDIVLVAGKGHEDYQETDGERHPFSDSAVIEEAIGECRLVTERVMAKKVMFRSAQC
jgi:UDP-N-acetylmuramoyl-L-alanyl-D-glutamate--2,6-diaminopimelate ligase